MWHSQTAHTQTLIIPSRSIKSESVSDRFGFIKWKNCGTASSSSWSWDISCEDQRLSYSNTDSFLRKGYTWCTNERSINNTCIQSLLQISPLSHHFLIFQYNLAVVGSTSWDTCTQAWERAFSCKHKNTVCPTYTPPSHHSPCHSPWHSLTENSCYAEMIHKSVPTGFPPVKGA